MNLPKETVASYVSDKSENWSHIFWKDAPCVESESFEVFIP